VFLLGLQLCFPSRSCKCFFFCLALRPDSGSWPPLRRLHDITHWTHHYSGRVISPSQRPLPENTQHSQEADVHAPAGFEPAILASEQPHTHGLHLSQNRQNAANQQLSGYTSQAHVATFNPTCLSKLIATQGLMVLRLLIVSDVKTHQKHTVFLFVGLGLLHQPLFHKYHLPFLQM